MSSLMLSEWGREVVESVILSRAPGSTEQGRKVLACLVTRARGGGREAACRDAILQLLQGEQVARHRHIGP